jgi:hypothetical protein
MWQLVRNDTGVTEFAGTFNEVEAYIDETYGDFVMTADEDLTGVLWVKSVVAGHEFMVTNYVRVGDVRIH